MQQDGQQQGQARQGDLGQQAGGGFSNFSEGFIEEEDVVLAPRNAPPLPSATSNKPVHIDLIRSPPLEPQPTPEKRPRPPSVSPPKITAAALQAVDEQIKARPSRPLALPPRATGQSKPLALPAGGTKGSLEGLSKLLNGNGASEERGRATGGGLKLPPTMPVTPASGSSSSVTTLLPPPLPSPSFATPSLTPTLDSTSNGFAHFTQQPATAWSKAPKASTSAMTNGHQHPPQDQQKQRRTTHSGPTPAYPTFGAFNAPVQPQAQQSLGRVPIISSSNARLPSFPASSSSSASQLPRPITANDYYRMHQASVAATIAIQQQQQPALASQTAQGPFVPYMQGRVMSGSKGKSREVIDLTEDKDDSEDDEVIVDETPICIGQLTSLALILYPVAELQPPPPPAGHDPSLPPPPPQPQPPLPIHIFRGVKANGNETLRLSTPHLHETFGVMEHRVANVVAPLLGDGYAGTGVTKGGNGILWCEASVSRRGERNPMMLPLNLLLFARPFDVPKISGILEQSTIYLEHPATYNPALHNGYRYSNPHNPVPGVDRRRMLAYQNTQKPVKAIDMARQQVEDVFQNLKSGVDLEEQEPEPIIATKLYPHQKQALSFLLDRENLVTVPESAGPNDETIVSLWRRKYDNYGRPVGWMSIVTDVEIPGAAPPPQARGSILADDMGLGKTIVVIALVAATLGEAREWAKQPPTKDMVDQRFDGVGEKNKKASTSASGTGIVDLDQFHSSLVGFQGLVPSGAGKSSSKKKEAKAKRERKRVDAANSRFEKLVTRSRGTLIVCPLSTVQNWESQFEEHVVRAPAMDGAGTSYIISERAEDDDEQAGKKGKGKGKAKIEDDDRPPAGAISVYVYHGNSRLSDPLKLADYDVVVTTFSTLGTEYSRQVRAEEERAAEAKEAEESDEEALKVYDADGNYVPQGTVVEAGKKKRKRKKIEGSGLSPLQQIQWFRVVLDEAHIIKEHTTIQARAACELSASRRTALSGTPLQNSLNDLFSLVRFLRLEPFTDRAVWTQYIGALAKTGDPLGVSRLQLIMRHLALRRTKTSVDKDGKPILSLPPNNQTLVHLAFDQAEHAFYNSHHNRYKHDFRQLEESDSVMKNYCSILQELLRLRQICVHMALVRDSEDNAKNGEGDDLIGTIQRHGISKPRAVQLLALMRDSGAAQCSECGHEMLAPVTDNVDELMDATEKKPVKKSRKTAKTATASAACSDEDAPVKDLISIVTRCQHLFCIMCFTNKVFPKYPAAGDPAEKAICTVCRAEISPALDVVALGGREIARAFDDAVDGEAQAAATGKKVKGTRLFEHSTKTKALLADLFPFSQANPASANFWGGMDDAQMMEVNGTIGFQPVKGEVVKSVVFSQWTKLLDRVGDALDDGKIKYGRLDGGMNRDQRTKAMDAFKSDPSCEVLLVSLRAGGVGLNLTVARRVYLMEPFWNPAVENQAVDRIHRLGQTMPVQTVRFVISKSIEENMLKIQERKMELANMSMSQTLSKQELAKRRLEDLKTLLS